MVFLPISIAISVCCSGTGFVVQTRGLKHGRAIVVSTCATVASIVSGVLAGMFALGERLPSAPCARLLLLLGWYKYRIGTREDQIRRTLRKLLDMSEALRSTLGYGLNLPSNLKPDDTELLFFYSRPREADSHDPIYRTIFKLSPNSDSDDPADYIIVKKKRLIKKPPEEIRQINEATFIDHITATKAKFEIEFSMESLMEKYGHCLDKESVFSPKARYRMEKCAIALTYFNETNKKDYKLVDCLPRTALRVGHGHVYHINFIARQNSPADPSKKLFFAELQTPVGVENLVVKSCHLIDEACETTAGCYLCTHYNGRRIVHPTSGFSFGLLPPADAKKWVLVDRV